ncbi:unnamed protein product [Closterium sp. Naga37s-1]|nr:unnamed protein product [Closterium sp. Naga37s-1]
MAAASSARLLISPAPAAIASSRLIPTATSVKLTPFLASSPATQRLLRSVAQHLSARHGAKRSGALTARCDLTGGAGLGPEELEAFVTAVKSVSDAAPHDVNSLMTLAVGLGLPCNVMECGDAIYLSSLAHEHHLTVAGAALLLQVGAYLWATPGVAAGYWDMFVLAKIDRFFRKTYKRSDLVLGKKIGEGGFGSVYVGTLAKDPDYKVIVKRVTEFGDVELWMNERVRRACPDVCAEFLGGFMERAPGSKRKTGAGKEQKDASSTATDGEVWLVWRYEGDSTFADILTDRDFPYNIEQTLFGTQTPAADEPRGPERELHVAREIMRRLLTSLEKLHSQGIVHRDVKPENMIYCKDKGALKIIDLGAAADLRVGINYDPDQYLLDPRYAAPEEYIMSTQTPSVPPAPVAAALAPILWQMNHPDRFDMYSAGLVFLQMIFPSLRSDTGLAAFTRQFKKLDYNLSAWREKLELRATADDMRRLELLDENGGHGWGLLESMLRKEGGKRINAKAALAHPFFHTREARLIKEIRNGLFVPKPAHFEGDEPQVWVTDLMARSGTQEAGGFTEVSLQMFKRNERRQQRKHRKRTDPSPPLATTEGSASTGQRDNSWWNVLEPPR